MRILKTMAAMFILFLFLSLPLQAQSIVYVDQQAPGANNGTSWHDAYLDLQDALTAASAGTTVRVADGDYSPSPVREATFQLKNDVILEGGYAGYGNPDPDERNIALYKTVLDGKGINYHVVTATGTNATSILDGFTITGGQADGEANTQRNGAGIYIESGNPAFIRCTIISNASAGLGGGMYGSSSSATWTERSFIENTAGLKGGGIYSDGEGSPAFIQCEFNANHSQSGGAMHIYDSDAALNECTFITNSADWGGAIYNYYSNASLTGCLFQKLR